MKKVFESSLTIREKKAKRKNELPKLIQQSQRYKQQWTNITHLRTSEHVIRTPHHVFP